MSSNTYTLIIPNNVTNENNQGIQNNQGTEGNNYERKLLKLLFHDINCREDINELLEKETQFEIYVYFNQNEDDYITYSIRNDPQSYNFILKLYKIINDTELLYNRLNDEFYFMRIYEINNNIKKSITEINSYSISNTDLYELYEIDFYNPG